MALGSHTFRNVAPPCSSAEDRSQAGGADAETWEEGGGMIQSGASY